jgi:hypothetical protein
MRGKNPEQVMYKNVVICSQQVPLLHFPFASIPCRDSQKTALIKKENRIFLIYKEI